MHIQKAIITNLSKKIKSRGLKAIFLGVLLSEAIDDLRDTTIYVKGLKQLCGRLVKVLKGYDFDYNQIYKKQPDFTINLSRDIDSLLNKMSKMTITEVATLNQLHDHYISDKDGYIEKFNIKIEELDKD